MWDVTGNLPTFPGTFPDYSAPIVRNAPDGERELTLARWGMPSPAFALKSRNSDSGITKVRNTPSVHWRRWLGVESRCLVPFTSFSKINCSPMDQGRRLGSPLTKAGRLPSSRGSGPAGPRSER